MYTVNTRSVNFNRLCFDVSDKYICGRVEYSISNNVSVTSYFFISCKQFSFSMSSDSVLHNRERSPTWISLPYLSPGNLIDYMLKVFDKFNWRTFFIVHDLGTTQLRQGVTFLVISTLMKKPNTNVIRRQIDSSKGVNYTSLLLDFRSQSRSD